MRNDATIRRMSKIVNGHLADVSKKNTFENRFVGRGQTSYGQSVYMTLHDWRSEKFVSVRRNHKDAEDVLSKSEEQDAP